MEVGQLISIIVPVYNAGDYLRECLESIAEQTCGNLEVILVDDGSTDGSADLCDAAVERDHRFQVIHQQNMGAATARRNGVLRASGDYICFVDADDMIDAGMMSFFRENMGECDLLTSGYRSETVPGRYELWTDSLGEGVYSSEKERKHFLENMISCEGRFVAGIQPYLMGKLYRTEILRKVIGDIDPKIVYSEDRDLLFRYILNAGSIRITYRCFYFYRYNPSSIIRTVNKNFMSDLNRLYLSLERAFSGHPQEESLMHQLQLFLLSRMYLIPTFMGFSTDAQMLGYVFPFSELEKGSRIVLYGAGTVGTRYYRQIHRQNLLRLVLWVDKNRKDYADCSIPVESPEQIMRHTYDYVIIAVKRKEMADEIRRELTHMGINEEQILWRPPALL